LENTDMSVYRDPWVLTLPVVAVRKRLDSGYNGAGCVGKGKSIFLFKLSVSLDLDIKTKREENGFLSYIAWNFAVRGNDQVRKRCDMKENSGVGYVLTGASLIAEEKFQK